MPLTKAQIREMLLKAEERVANSGGEPDGADVDVVALATKLLRPAKRRKIFLVTAIVADGDGSRQRVTYGVAARGEDRARQMVDEAVDAQEYNVVSVEERANPWVVSTGSEG